MSTLVNVLNQILQLEKNSEYFMTLDKLIVDLNLAQISNKDLELLLGFTRKLITKRPNNETLLLINGIMNELNQFHSKKFLSVYSFFLKYCKSQELKNEIIWFISYQKKDLGGEDEL
jgi:hypothetical protein